MSLDVEVARPIDATPEEVFDAPGNVWPGGGLAYGGNAAVANPAWLAIGAGAIEDQIRLFGPFRVPRAQEKAKQDALKKEK